MTRQGVKSHCQGPGCPQALVVEGSQKPADHVFQLPGARLQFPGASARETEPALPCALAAQQSLAFRLSGFCIAHLPPICPSGSDLQRTGRASCILVSTHRYLPVLCLGGWQVWEV